MPLMAVVFCAQQAGPNERGSTPRQAPSAVYSLTISSPVNAVKPGEPIRISITLTNLTKAETALVFYRAERTEQMLGYHFVVRDEHGGLLSMKNANVSAPQMSRKYYTVSVAPGESLKHTVELSEIHDLTKVGKYDIQVQKLDEARQIIVKSNSIIVAVTN